MKCVSGKRIHPSEELAKEALIQNRIRYNHREGSGPINIYQCPDCEAWHFTSSGEMAEFLKDPSVIKRIQEEIRSSDWSDEY